MWNKKIIKESGMTLIEIMVAMSIFLFVIIVSSDFIITGLRSTTFASEKADAIQHARQGMEIITKEIRGANSSEAGSYPINTAEDQNLVFYCDLDDDGLMERIEYTLVDSELIKSVTEPGNDNAYSEAPAVAAVAQYINNQEEPLFFYYDRNYAETDSINNIRIINIKLKVNVTPERAPADYYVESDVNLRNLKDNL